MSVSIVKLTLAMLFVSATTAWAEPILTLDFGTQYNGSVSSIKGNENTNYPDAPDPMVGPLLPDVKASTVRGRSSTEFGVGIGYYLDKHPSFGADLEVSRSNPSFKTQCVTVTSDLFAPILSQAGYDQKYVTNVEPKVGVRLTTIAAHVLYRYRGLGPVTPYVGVGPALLFYKVSGTGDCCVSTSPPNSDIASGPNLHETNTSVGGDLKFGVDYAVNKDFGIGVNAHYRFGAMKLSNFRSLSGVKGDFSDQAVLIQVTRHF